MEIKKITNKIKLSEQNVKAENYVDELKYKCAHDCVEYHYTGSTSAKGCRRTSTVSAKLSPNF